MVLNKNKRKSMLKKISNFWYNYFNERQRKIIVFLLICWLISCLIFVSIYGSYKLNNSFVDKTVCINAMKEYAIKYSNLSYNQMFFLEYKPLIFLLIGCIGLGWVLHGVGFKVIG